MKRIVAIIAAAAMFCSISGCGCKKQAVTEDIKKEKQSQNTVSPSQTPAPAYTELPKADGDEYAKDSGGGGLTRLSPADEVPDIDEKKDERNFSGMWRATATTSESQSFEAMTVEIHYDSYSVFMTFGGTYPSVTYEGKYKIKDGVLIFDKNFEDCTAYFYDDQNDTLVLDNGTSLVFCTRIDEEELQ